MSTSLNASFASAAAGSNGSANRREGTGDWSRNRPNGATQTFRRPSAQTTSQTRDMPPQNPSSVQSPGAYIPPHLNSNHPSSAARNGTSEITRYSKEQMFAIFQSQRDSNNLTRHVPQVVEDTWLQVAQDHSAVPPTPRGESADQYPGPGVCWKDQPEPLPWGLRPMDEEEKQLFTSSVNSPIKISQTPKDAGGVAPIGTRKTSISNYNAGVGSRPGTRRRDTSDSFPANGPMSPVENKSFFRGESSAATPPPALLRRRTDYKEDGPAQKEVAKEEEESQAPIGSMRRANGPLSAGLNPPTNSPWASGPGGSAFGSMGTFGSFTAAPPAANQDKTEQRPGFGSARGASRFKDLLTKSSSEDMQSANKDRSGFGSLAKLPEEGGGGSVGGLKTRPNRSETNPYEELPNRTGSAALSSQGDSGAADATNFGSIGRSHGGLNETVSPAHTNPYQSPYGARDDGPDANDPQAQAPFGSARRALFGDDSTPRSAGGFGGFPGFNNPASASAWPNAGLGTGTPVRDRNMGFGDPIFSSMGDLQSPGAGLGSGFFGGGFGSMGRASNRLGGMLPTGMDDPMRGDSRNKGRLFDRPESGLQRDPFDNGFARASGAFEDGAIGSGRLDGDAFRAGFPGQPPQEPAPLGSADQGSPASESAQHTPTSGTDSHMPAAQQRTMCMPDRMRWIYRDPQGKIQGPWSGLEMHDWFKAGFFTAELLVKKVEDTEFEPLAQLIRRIGNSREPFLVPQIGVPHGPDPTPGTQSNWPNAAPPPPGNNSQPPFPNVFPSFGTTLTADQQNALERRKQEEQYLMARQKEHLAQQQQQLMVKQMHGGQPHGMHSLQHHSSAQSLHSQPSFGSMTSPGPSFHPNTLPPGQMAHGAIGQPPYGREEELPGFMDRLNVNQRGPVGAPGDGQMSQAMQDRQRLQQQPIDTRAHQEAFLGQQGRNERLEEFQELRGQPETGRSGPETILAPIGAQRTSEETSRVAAESKPAPVGQPISKATISQVEPPSLTEQVQWTTAHQHEKPPQPPPVSISPLPAPAAQRNRQHVAESLVQEPRSQTQTPIDTPATSVAPWAERTVDAPRGPSLREIQEAEAKKAAQQQAIMNAARQAQAEQERLAESVAVPPAPGLPASATWGVSPSPSTPTAGSGSVWAKPTVKLGTPATGPAKKTLAQIQKEEEARKQRATATAAAQAQAQNANSPVSGVTGKRYAELASKAAAAVPASTMTNSAWTTVGSGGKVKPPTTILAATQPTPRAVSSTTTAVPAAAKARPAMPVSRAVSTAGGEKTRAHDEFVRWVKGQLGKGLNSSINVDNFVQDLLLLPPEIEIIADSVYANSQTLDGRRIAEEFVRRRKNADKGIFEPVSGGIMNGSGGDGKSASGWSEVAKKGPGSENRNKDGTAAAEVGTGVEQFKVVAGKKKGGKR